RGAGIEVADHTDDLRVDELLRDRGAHLRIGLVVLGDQRELRVLAVDLDAGGVGLLDGKARAVLVVLAEVRYPAGQGRDMADLDAAAVPAAAGGRDRERQQRDCELGVLHWILRGIWVRTFGGGYVTSALPGESTAA